MSETREYGPTKILRVTDAQEYEPTSLSGGKDDYTTTDYLEITGQADNAGSTEFPHWQSDRRGTAIYSKNDESSITEMGFAVKGNGHIYFANDLMAEKNAQFFGSSGVQIENGDLYVKGNADIDGNLTADGAVQLGTSIVNHIVYNTVLILKSYTVAAANAIPSEQRPAGSLIWVSDEPSGACVAYSDGTNWRRIDTGALIPNV